MEVFEAIDTLITNLLSVLGNFGAVLGCVFILFESIIPILPLSVFITLNFMTFGTFIGFLISWIFTVLGCMLSFYIFKFLLCFLFFFWWWCLLLGPRVIILFFFFYC